MRLRQFFLFFFCNEVFSFSVSPFLFAVRFLLSP